MDPSVPRGQRNEKSSNEKRSDLRGKVSRLKTKDVVFPRVAPGKRGLTPLERVSVLREKDRRKRLESNRKRVEKKKETRESEGTPKKRKRAAEGRSGKSHGGNKRRGKQLEKKEVRGLVNDAVFQEYMRSMNAEEL